jgi:hypothetical protein
MVIQWPPLGRIVTGVLLPLSLAFIIRRINNREIMGDDVNDRVYNVLASATVVAGVGSDHHAAHARAAPLRALGARHARAGMRPSTYGPTPASVPARLVNAQRTAACASTI